MTERLQPDSPVRTRMDWLHRLSVNALVVLWIATGVMALLISGLAIVASGLGGALACLGFGTGAIWVGLKARNWT